LLVMAQKYAKNEIDYSRKRNAPKIIGGRKAAYGRRVKNQIPYRSTKG